MTHYTPKEALKFWSENCATYSQEIDAYAELTSQGWAFAILSNVPPRMRGGIIRWVLFGVEPGDFLCAVLRNNLKDAAAAADDENRRLLWEYCNALHNGAPSQCWGGATAFASWKGIYPKEAASGE